MYLHPSHDNHLTLCVNFCRFIHPGQPQQHCLHLFENSMSLSVVYHLNTR